MNILFSQLQTSSITTIVEYQLAASEVTLEPESIIVVQMPLECLGRTNRECFMNVQKYMRFQTTVLVLVIKMGFFTSIA